MASNWDSSVNDLNFKATVKLYDSVLEDHNRREIRELADASLYFFMVGVLGMTYALHPFVQKRANEVQRDPDGHLDLWARFHFKSSIITFALLLWDIAHNPEVRACILSYTKNISRGFQGQHKREMETNATLPWLWPDVFWRDPRKESPKWSDNEGLMVRRTGNARECTIESFGLTDGQPISRHYGILNYDDVVVKDSVGTPEQIRKTTDCWELSQALGEDGTRVRVVGTRYHPRDTYDEMLRRGSVTARVYPATDDGTKTGRPVLLSVKKLDELMRDMKSNFSPQMLLKPVSEDTAMFKKDWLCYYTEAPPRRWLNVYILVDPAGGKDKRLGSGANADYTVMMAVGLCDDGNYYLLDGVRDKLNLAQRTALLFRLVRKWRPRKVVYEEYGMQSDCEHIRYVMERDQYRFKIDSVGGPMPKLSRIERLVGVFSEYRWWMPHRLPFVTANGEIKDFVAEFVDDEYSVCPVLSHDDMLDCAARIFDADAVFPAWLGRNLRTDAGAKDGNRTDDTYKVL